MSRDPTPIEVEALTRSGALIQFAAEHVKDVPKSLVTTTCAAWDAYEAKKWDAQVATDFWVAFNALCELIKPVTLDTLSTNVRELPPPRWRFWQKDPPKVSLSKRSAGRYLAILMTLLGVAISLSFLSATAQSLSSELSHLIESGNQATATIEADLRQLEPTIGEKPISLAGNADPKIVARVQNERQEQNHLLDQLFQKAKLMTRLVSLGIQTLSYEKGTLEPDKTTADVREAVRNYYVCRRDIEASQQQEAIYATMITSSLLPIILGLMGACAYVLRLISEQIKDTTFSATSPIRHMVRFALGGLAGVVIGFGGVAKTASLSPSALAFIAGYAIEPVFSTFDSIAEKFRR
jgi:predicted PurR-regulated permease PerM